MSPKSTLQQWLNRKNKATNDSSTPPARQQGTPIPLSFGQQQLWLLQQLHGDNPFYHYAETYHLRGPLVVAHLVRAYELLVERHEILRTTFDVHEGQARQTIRQEAAFELKEYDLSKLQEEAKTSEKDRICQENAVRPFHLAEGPLSRLAVIKLGPEEHFLLLNLHHIITDKWSMQVLREDLVILYEQLCAKQTPALPPLPLQYGDYAYQQRNTPANAAHLAYWLDKLAAAPQILELPLDNPRPQTPSFRGEYKEKVLSLELSEQLRALSKSLGVTLFMLMLAAYKVLLSRYSNQRDILVGTPVTNRDRKDLERLIGFFNDTIVLRTKLDDNPSFASLAEAVKQTTLDAFSHNAIPFESLVKSLNPERRPNVNPVFQAMFILHVVPPKPSFTENIEFTHAPFDMGTTKFDLTLYISDGEPQLRSLFEYATDLFEPSTIERMQGHFQTLLEAIVSNPHQGIDELPILTPAEEVVLRQEQAATSPTASHILDYFDECVRQYPDRIAVSYQGEQLSYQELDEQANSIAHQIIEQGETKHPLVGLYTERSLAMITGIIAILKAGRAYVPLDPDYPSDRIKYIVEDSGLTTILTHQPVAENLADFDSLKLIDITKPTAVSTPAPKTAAQPTDLAYVIYTSGSTGRPKGIAVTQANLVHSTSARFHYYPTEPEAFLLLSSFSFDSSVVGIFWTLTRAGKLVLTPKRIEQDLDTLANIIAGEVITHTLMLPSLYEAVLQFIDTDKLMSLQTVIVAGEACGQALCREHFALLPDTKLYNEYGPTEATVWCTAHEIKEADLDTPIPIGKAIPGTTVYIMNSRQSLLPAGVEGEIYVGGPGVTPGYWQQAELTKTHFLPDPFQPGTGKQLYRTGDLAKYRPDGTIQFLGRADQQVKFRGYRIELDEIRAGINQFDGITDSVVLVNQERRQLVAYVISLSALREQELGTFLKQTFPDYMVPTLFVPIDKIPRLPNGKTDLKTLPEPPKRTGANASDTGSATSEAEEQFLQIWEEILQFDGLTVHDNFFEIGGDSILSIQITARIRKLGIKLPPNAIFNHQTIAELALFASSVTDEAMQEETLEGPLPLLPIQHWFFNEHRNAAQHWNQGFCFSVPADTDAERLQAAFTKVIAQHDSLRLKFNYKEGVWSQEVVVPAQANFHVLDLKSQTKAQQNDEIAKTIANYAKGFSLAAGNIICGLYFKCAPQQADQLAIIAHHLLVDMVSWQVILDDLINYYQQGENQEAILSQAFAYSKWAKQLEEWAKKDRFKDELSFWAAQKQTNIPTDFEETLPVTESELETVSFSIEESATHQLLKQANQAYHTSTEDILIAALLATLADFADLPAVCLGIEHHGREMEDWDGDLSQTVGWMTTYYPLTIAVGTSPDIGDRIKSVKEQLRAVPHKGIGYGVLRYLAKEPSLNQSPALLFNYLGIQSSLKYPILGEAQVLHEQMRSPKSERFSAWDINTLIQADQLQVNWSFSKRLHLRATLERLAQAYQATLLTFIEHCVQQDESTYTPSDFPDADIDQSDLDHLLGQIDL